MLLDRHADVAASCAPTTLINMLNATIDVSTMKLTVTSDKRKVQATITVGGEEAKVSALLEPVVSDPSGRTWKKLSDDGSVAVYQG